MTPEQVWKLCQRDTSPQVLWDRLRHADPVRYTVPLPSVSWASCADPVVMPPTLASEHWRFLLHITDKRADKGKPLYAVYGQRRGEDDWHMCEGPWPVGEGPYDRKAS